MQDYAELLCKTNYSFLTGASYPGEYIERAQELGLTAIGITDRNGVYGIPKAYRALKNLSSDQKTLPKLIVGTELELSQDSVRLPAISLLACDRRGYGLMCRMLTAAHADKPKGEASLSWDEFVSYLSENASKSLIAMPRGQIDPQSYPHHVNNFYKILKELFNDRLYLPLVRHLDGWDAKRTSNVQELAKQLNSKIIATNDVHYHVAKRRKLQDIQTAIRSGVTLKSAGMRLFSNAERHLKSPLEMARLFCDLPSALHATLEAAERCTFSVSELRYRYPSEWIPSGYTAQGYLEELTRKGCEWRYPDGPPSNVRDQLGHELKLVAELGFADYFLTIWEIVEFSRSKNILCQGRGSAANSIICFVLGITAVDPVCMNLLFERFLSAERGEPPDIDVDFEHERREEVIQHIYEKYGRHRAAMVAAVICYRERSSIREVSKVLEVDLEEAKAGKTPAAVLVRKLSDELHGFPRHLSIHSGGFTLSADPIIETVPVEPARMDGRTIVQWDKDDLDAVGLLKVDVLALGMLTAIKKCCEKINLTLATIPPDDLPTYEMIQRAETVGVFQIESRAQMNMLGRLKPENFYDLVVQVAIVRPGPIVGKMVHPYLRRRKGLEPIEVPHPKLTPILAKTLGVPLFQEQVMKMAIELAGFSPGEADELRRAIGAWRSSGSIEKMGRKLMNGLLASGLPRDYVERIFEQIKGFSEYGFPESHAASFALLAYASSYLKCHYPDEFACALLNSQPMGFYAPHSIIDEVKRYRVRVLPVHPNFSDWDSFVPEKGVLQLGFRVVSGLAKADGEILLRERANRPFLNLADFLSRARLSPGVLSRLAMGGAFECFGYERRDALWEILAQAMLTRPDPRGQLSLFAGVDIEREELRLFGKLGQFEEIQADYGSFHLSTRGHPMQALRASGPNLPRLTTRQARAAPNGRVLSCAGLVIVRQRPPTAAGTVFSTLEDEEGFLDLVFHKDVYAKYEEVFASHSFMVARGLLQRDGSSVSLLVRSLKPALIEDSTIEGISRHFAWKY